MHVFGKAAPAPSIIEAVTLLLRQLRVPVAAATVKEALQEHPDYPSLTAVSSVLRSWRVDSLAARVAPEQLADLSLPCLVHIGDAAAGTFVVLEEVTTDTVRLQGASGPRQLPLEKFHRSWSGIVLLAEADAQAGDPAYRAQQQELWVRRLAGTALVCLLAAGLLYGAVRGYVATPQYAALWLSQYVVKLVGATVAGLLTLQQLGRRLGLVERVCTLQEDFSCASVLNSAAATLTPWLSAAEAGAFYFIGGWLVLLVSPYLPTHATLPTVLHVAALAALPYTVFSIYYQKYVVRQWCVLCLVVQGCLWLEGGMALFALTRPDWSWSWMALVQAAGLGLIVPAIWLVVRPAVKSLGHYQLLRRTHRKYQTNVAFFDSLLREQPAYQHTCREHDLLIGEPTAPIVITLLMNPTCHPCKEVFEEALQLQQQLPDEVQLAVRLLVKGNRDVTALTVAQHLLQLPPAQQLPALTAWGRREYAHPESWQQQFPVPAGADAGPALARLHAWQQWCQAYQLHTTPTVFVDEHLLPDQFTLPELEFYLREKAARLPVMA